jgi:diguanylate cyclase (GGDEF)-like protein
MRSAAEKKPPVSGRQLKYRVGGALWLSTTVVIVAASFVPQVAPDHVNFWRATIGLSALTLAACILYFGPRWPARSFDLVLELNLIPALGANLLVLQITPATGALLFNLLVTMIFVGYFVRPPALVASIAGGVLIALSTLVTSPAKDTPHLASLLVVFIPVLVVMTLLLHLQSVETLRAVVRARREAHTDPLTGLGNLRALEKRAAKLLRPDQSGKGVGIPGLLLIDLDNFKSANSAFGHVGGDHALRVIAEQLERVAPTGAVVTRIGGDEFAVLLTGESRERIVEYGEILRSGVRAAGSVIDLEGLAIDASVGVATYPDDGTDLSGLLSTADKAMYADKGAKRHPVPQLERAGAAGTGKPAWLEGLTATPENDFQPPVLDTVAGGKLPWLSSRHFMARSGAFGWAAGAVLVAIGLLMPGAYPDPLLPWWSMLVIAVISPPVILLANTKPGTSQHLLGDAFGFVVIAMIIAGTGGIASPALPLLVLFCVAQSWYWQTRYVAFRLIAPILVALSPLLYTPFSGSQEDVLAVATLYGLVALLVTLIGATYYDRVVLLRLKQRAVELATTDPLTGIENRRSFELAVQALLDDPEGGEFAIVMLDLDDFKQVNTSRGHQAGDQLLKAIARSLQAASRDGDCIARIGGDEFAAAIPGVGVDAARALAERLVRAVAETDEARQGGVGASAGFALHPLHGDSLDELVFTADGALMAVKASGKGSARVARIVSAVQ